MRFYKTIGCLSVIPCLGVLSTSTLAGPRHHPDHRHYHHKHHAHRPHNNHLKHHYQRHKHRNGSSIHITLAVRPQSAVHLVPIPAYRHPRPFMCAASCQPRHKAHASIRPKVKPHHVGLTHQVTNSSVFKQAEAALIQIQNQNPGSHFYSRHGAQTSLHQQWLRSTTGLTPDGELLQPVHGSRWISHLDQLQYLKKAELIHLNTGQNVIDLTAPQVIGEGYLIGGKKFVKTKEARFVFSHGVIVAGYPLFR